MAELKLISSYETVREPSTVDFVLPVLEVIVAPRVEQHDTPLDPSSGVWDMTPEMFYRMSHVATEENERAYAENAIGLRRMYIQPVSSEHLRGEK